MDHLLYSAEDFARDESYLRYYFRLNPDDVAYWQDWISRHPEKLDVIVSADHLISLLALHLPEDEFQAEYERILKAVKPVQGPPGISNPAPEEKIIPRHSSGKPTALRRIAAASVILILAIAGYFIFIGRHNASDMPSPLAAGMDRKTNTSGRTLEFGLEDGSRITLEPGASLIFPHHFLPGKREVSLEGNAFFKISRNPKRPFYIYCNNLVTHVLGTSFSISTDKANKKVEVSVRTGKVEVYEKLPGTATGGKRKSNGVILMPNQKVIYKEDQQQFETTLADNPMPLVADTANALRDAAKDHPNFIYQAVPLSSLINSIRKTYGIEIEVENENLNNCHFSGDVSDLNLYEQLDAICKSIDASYELKGTQILIRGAGCEPAKK